MTTIPAAKSLFDFENMLPLLDWAAAAADACARSACEVSDETDACSLDVAVEDGGGEDGADEDDAVVD